MRIGEQEKIIKSILREAQIDSPDLCARLLTAHVSGLDRINYILAWDQVLSPAQVTNLNKLAARRCAGEPLAYILGKKEFYSRDFIVSPATLIPRPETELVVELALQHLPESPVLFVDIGCGCGCIGLTLLLERPLWRGILIDNNSCAMECAKKNAILHDCRAICVLGDMFYSPFQADTFDLVVANPPYISIKEKSAVMWETLTYEPHYALFSEMEGLDHLKAVVKLAKTSLKSSGWLMLEHGENQAPAVFNLLEEQDFINIKTYRDLAGKPRCTTGCKKG